MKIEKAKFIPVLDRDFRPASLENRDFLDAVRKSGKAVPLAIALERGNGLISAYEAQVFAEDYEDTKANLYYVERLVKTLLWQRGGWKITIGGPVSIGQYIKKAYAPGGLRENAAC